MWPYALPSLELISKLRQHTVSHMHAWLLVGQALIHLISVSLCVFVSLSFSLRQSRVVPVGLELTV